MNKKGKNIIGINDQGNSTRYFLANHSSESQDFIKEFFSFEGNKATCRSNKYEPEKSLQKAQSY